VYKNAAQAPSIVPQDLTYFVVTMENWIDNQKPRLLAEAAAAVVVVVVLVCVNIFMPSCRPISLLSQSLSLFDAVNCCYYFVYRVYLSGVNPGSAG